MKPIRWEDEENHLRLDVVSHFMLLWGEVSWNPLGPVPVKTWLEQYRPRTTPHFVPDPDNAVLNVRNRIHFVGAEIDMNTSKIKPLQSRGVPVPQQEAYDASHHWPEAVDPRTATRCHRQYHRLKNTAQQR